MCTIYEHIRAQLCLLCKDPATCMVTVVVDQARPPDFAITQSILSEVLGTVEVMGEHAYI